VHFVIFGAGGIGATIGARLFQAGERVDLIVRGAHLDALRRDGLVFRTPEGEARLAIPAHADPATVDWGPDSTVLLTTKSQHTGDALATLDAVGMPELPVVCAQNGVENERAALRRFRRVYAMVVILPAVHLEPGVVVTYAKRPGGVLDVGCYPNGVDVVAAGVADALTRAGFSSRPDAAVMRQKYAKLLTNLNNALQAVAGGGEDARAIAAELKEEALACYRAAGIAWSDDGEARARRREGLVPGEVPGEPRRGGSSWQSLARGTGDVESDYLNGEVVLLGRLHRVPTPANAALQRAAREMAKSRRAPGSMPIAEVRARIDAERRR
jgi:2-dehydropantoate 2-reductase